VAYVSAAKKLRMMSSKQVNVEARKARSGSHTRSLDIIESRDLELDLMENSSRSAAPCRPTTGRSARAKPAAPCARGLGAASSKTRSYFMTSLPSNATLRPRSRRWAGRGAPSK
jgi:hypothetical protein